MNTFGEGFYWVLAIGVVALGIAGIVLAVRLTPDPSNECVRLGGNWSTVGDVGHCERSMR